MKLGNRLIAVIMSLMMIISSSVVMVQAADTPQIVISSAQATTGEPVELTISMSNNPGIVSMTLEISYNTEAFALKEVNDSGLLPGAMHTTKLSSPYTLTWENDTSNVNFTVNGELAVLSFDVLTETVGDYEFSINVPKDGIYNLDLDNIDFELVNGTVSVICEHSMTHTDAKAATCIETGNVENWYCSSCKTYFADADGTVPLQDISIAIDSANHVGDTEIRGAVTETCKDPGYTGDTYCLDCLEKIADGEVISATGNHVDADGMWEHDENGHWHTCGCGTKFDEDVHAGGEATCNAKATCEICEAAYGDIDAQNHVGDTEIRDAVTETCKDPGYTGNTYCLDCGNKIADGENKPATGNHVDADGMWEHDENGHWHTCGCGTKFDEDVHTGGEATCNAAAVCESCSAGYGELDARNHQGDTELRNEKSVGCFDNGYTGDTYCLACNTVITPGTVITARGYHTDADGKWESDGTNHWHTCECGAGFDEFAHTGGEATCTKKAMCEVCTAAYGEINPEKHVGETEVTNKKEETCKEDGYTGDTYCLDCLEKIADGEVISATGNHVDADGKWESDGTNHWHTCVCGTRIDETVHTGGEATCNAKAICETCETPYGDIDAQNHVGDTEIRNALTETCKDDGYTGDTYCLDCGNKIANGEVISATGNHVDADGKWESDGTNHWHTCVCGTRIDETVHTGGEATCNAKAICETCETPYGDIDAQNHVGDTEIRNKVPVGCVTDGYTGDTYCLACDTLLTEGETVPAVGYHIDTDDKWEYDSTNHWHTCVCGEKFDTVTHTGGNATCYAKAICEICENAYGSYSNDHQNTYRENSYSATCNTPGYTGDTYCYDCGRKVYTGTTLPATNAHYGGEATCENPAVCANCNMPYGERNADNHKAATEILNAAEATLVREGYTGDICCSACKAVLESGSVIPKLEPVPVVKTENPITVETVVTGSAAKIESIDLDALNQKKEETTEPDAGTETDPDTGSETDPEAGTETVPEKPAPSTTVDIDLTGLDTEIKEAALPANILDTIAQAVEEPEIAADSLAIHLSTGTMQLDDKTVLAMVEQSEGDTVRLVIDDSEEENLNELQQEALKELNVHGKVDIYMECESSGKRISDFNGGTATIKIPFTIPEGHHTVGFQVWYVDEDGNRTPLDTRYENGNIVWDVEHFSDYVIIYEEPTVEGAENPYTDVSEDAWYYDDVLYSYVYGLMIGTGDDKFEPETELSRAMFVTILWRIAGSPVISVELPFSDVPANTWYSNAVAWAYAYEIVKGYDNGCFGPTDIMNREQMAAFLYRYEQFKGGGYKEETTFTLENSDADTVSDWALESVRWLAENEIYVMHENNVLDPLVAATRAESAAVLRRYSVMKEDEKKAAQK
ncbi:MAG: hypothetical protein E7604_07330 [Ruminococcaceae bacterium]|nr:hypothetical protein [Oscillospiraceae bacterium]